MSDVTPDEIRRVADELVQVLGFNPEALSVLKMRKHADDLEAEQKKAQRDEELGRIAYRVQYPEAPDKTWELERAEFRRGWVTIARAVREAIEAGK